MSCADYVYKCHDCVDAWELSRMYGCHESPNPIASIDEVDVGDCVEVNHNGERFWIKVTDVCRCFIVGEIISNLIYNHPFNKGQNIRVEIWAIYNVDKACYSNSMT